MNATNIPSPADLYRHRHDYDAIKNAALSASNKLGAMFSTLLVPANWQPIHDRALESRKILEDILDELKELQIQHQRNLPSLPPESTISLEALDKKLASHERSACQWILSHRSRLRSKGNNYGDWISLNECIWLSFDLRPELDLISSEVTDLGLSWRFPSLEVRFFPNIRSYKVDHSPFFRFGKWADDHCPVDRSEVTGLRSELLKAFLPHVPELAFIAAYVSTCTLSFGKGTEWRASLADLSP